MCLDVIEIAEHSSIEPTISVCLALSATNGVVLATEKKLPSTLSDETTVCYCCKRLFPKVCASIPIEALYLRYHYYQSVIHTSRNGVVLATEKKLPSTLIDETMVRCWLGCRPVNVMTLKDRRTFQYQVYDLCMPCALSNEWRCAGN